MFVANPAKTPARLRHAMKGVQDMRRSEAGHSVATHSPASIEQDTSAAVETGQEVRAAQVGPHHFVGMRGVRDADMPDMMPAEGWALVRAHDPLVSLATHHVCFR